MASGAALAILIRAQDEASSTLEKVKSSVASLGPMMATAGVAIGAAAVAGGAALYKLGSDFDSAYDKIRIGTGATGQSLEALKEDFRAVAGQVPDDLGKIGSAIADINTRTGATGPQLQTLSKQFLDLSRITGQDMTPAIASVTRVFGDWGVSAEDQAGTMDKLWRVSQSTGIGVNELSQKVVQFGAPLRAMGFSLDESAGLLGKWEKEGVNAELVLGSMRIAMGNFAREGVPMREGLNQTIAKIQALGPGAESTSLAMKVFGARAGPDMAAAILEGRFELGALLDQITNGSETIASAAEDTADFSEKWAKHVNNAKLALEPLASAVFDLAGRLLDVFGPALVAVISGIAQFGLAVKTLFAVFTDGGDDTTAALDTLYDALDNLFGPDIAGLVTDFVQTVRETFANVVRIIQDAIGTVTQVFRQDWLPDDQIEPFTRAVGDIAVVFRDVIIPIVSAAIQFVIARFSELVTWTRTNWPLISEIIRNVLAVIEAVVMTVTSTVGAIWSAHGQTITAIATTIWNTVGTIVNAALQTLLLVVNAALLVLRGNWQGAWENVVAAVGVQFNAMKEIIGGALSNIGERVLAGAKAIGQAIIDGIVAGVTGFGAAVGSAVTNVANAAINAAKTALGIASPSKEFESIGRATMEGMVTGIQGSSLSSTIKSTLQDFLATTRDYLSSANQIKGVEEEIGRVRQSAQTAALFRARDMVTVTSEELRLKQSLADAERNLLPQRQALDALGKSISAIERGSLEQRRRLIEIDGESNTLRLKALDIENQLAEVKKGSKAEAALRAELALLQDKQDALRREAETIRITNSVAATSERLRQESLRDTLKGSEDNIGAINRMLDVLRAEDTLYRANEAVIENATTNEINYRKMLIAVFEAESVPLKQRLANGLALVNQLKAEGAISEELADALHKVAGNLEGINQTKVQLRVDGSALDKVSEAVKSLAKNLGDAATNAAKLAGTTSGKGGSVWDKIKPRALGGPVQAGQAYLVGERGPELFVSPQSGTIVPNSSMVGLAGGGTSVVNEFHFHGSIFGSQDIEDTLVRALNRAADRGRIPLTTVGR